MAKKRYQNYDQVENMNTFSDMLRWSKERRNKPKGLNTQIPYAEKKRLLGFEKINRIFRSRGSVIRRS